MVGLHGKTSPNSSLPIVYFIGPVCAPAKFSRTHQTKSVDAEKLNRIDEVGSDEGVPFELMCPAETVVIGAAFMSAPVNTNAGVHTYLVTPLTLRCSQSLDASSIQKVAGAEQPLPQASQHPFTCPDGNAAFAIKGNAGQFIDALSLGCHPY